MREHVMHLPSQRFAFAVTDLLRAQRGLRPGLAAALVQAPQEQPPAHRTTDQHPAGHRSGQRGRDVSWPPTRTLRKELPVTHRTAPEVRPMFAAAGLICGVLAVAAGLPLADRIIALLARSAFGGQPFGPALSQLILLAVGVTAFACAAHHAIRPLTSAENR